PFFSSCRRPYQIAVRGGRHGNRTNGRSENPALPTLRASRWVDHAQVRGDGARFGHFAPVGRTDGRRDWLRERPWRGLAILVYGSVSTCNRRSPLSALN